MDLNSLIFPAPPKKKEYPELVDNLIWIPIYEIATPKISDSPAMLIPKITLRSSFIHSTGDSPERSISSSCKQLNVNRSVPRMPLGDIHLPKSPEMKIERVFICLTLETGHKNEYCNKAASR